MADPAQLHQTLLQTMRDKGVFQDRRVEAAFAAVPRHLFLQGHPLDVIYDDRAIAIKQNEAGLVVSSSSQPTMMALMFQQLRLSEGANVLEIGTATGYNAAVLQQVVGESGRVTTIEIDPELAQQARDNLQSAGYSHVTVVASDAVAGYPPNAPYDAIIATAGVWDVPSAWCDQLKVGGRLVVPIWLDGVQVSAAFVKQDDGTFYSASNSPCAFVYLRGEAAGPRMQKRVGSTSLYLLADDVDRLDTAALHMLLSDDHELCHLGAPLDAPDFWYGFQLYLMLREPSPYVFAVYTVLGEQKVYGLEGRGIAFFSPGSASFAPYEGQGYAHCFGGSDSIVTLQQILADWDALERPGMEKLRLRLMPHGVNTFALPSGKCYTRREHDLYVWLENVPL